jgi:hypothetical protein
MPHLLEQLFSLDVNGVHVPRVVFRHLHEDFRSLRAATHSLELERGGDELLNLFEISGFEFLENWLELDLFVLEDKRGHDFWQVFV